MLRLKWSPACTRDTSADRDTKDSLQWNRKNQLDPFSFGELRDAAAATLRKNFQEQGTLLECFILTKTTAEDSSVWWLLFVGGGRGIKGIPLTRELHCKPQPGSFYFFSYKEITCHEEKSHDLTAFTNNTTLTSCQRRYFCSWFALYISQHLIHSIHHLSSDECGISRPCWAFPRTKLNSALELNLKSLFISCLW